MIQPETRYTTVGGDRVAYQVLGNGPRDLVFSWGQWGHVDLEWEEPSIARFYRRVASFSRLIRFNARGSGLSDARPGDGHGAWEHWREDLLAVMDAAGSKTAAFVGAIDSGPMLLQFSADYPERVSALVLMNSAARFTAAPDYPEGFSAEQMDGFLAFSLKYYGTERWARANCPSLAHDERALRWTAKLHRAAGSPREFAESFRNQQQMDARSALPRIRAPTLIIRRQNYQWLTLAQARYVVDHVAGARFVEVPGADQDPYRETPDLILDHIEEFVTGQRHGGEPDRMLTTILFTDIVGSTERAAKLGDKEWRALLDRHDGILREQVGFYGGKVADHSGDGSLSTFENPRRAIECALALHKALADIGVDIRAGIHFGEVEKRTDGGVSGVSVHVGARVMALAGAGEVLISGTLRQILIGSRYAFEDRGTHELKGVPDQWRIYAVSEGQ